MFKILFTLLSLTAFGLCSTRFGMEAKVNTEGEDPFSTTRGLINNVIASLQNTATEAGEAVTNFTNGIQHQVEDFRENLAADINQIQLIFQEAANNVSSGISTASDGINNCITETRKQSEFAMNEAMHSIGICVDNLLENVISEVSSLITITTYATEAANEMREKVQNCGSSSSSDIFSVGRCLGAALWETNIKAVTITGQSTVLIARINLSIVTLPASMNVCIATEIPRVAATVTQLSQSLAQCALGTAALTAVVIGSL